MRSLQILGPLLLLVGGEAGCMRAGYVTAGARDGTPSGSDTAVDGASVDGLAFDLQRHDALWADSGSTAGPTADGLLADVALADAAAVDVAPADVAPADVAPADVAPADVAPVDVAPADAAPGDASLPDAQLDALLPGDLQAPDAGCQAPLDWWNGSYAHRRRLTIAETIPGSLPAAYTVVVILDTLAPINSGKMLGTAADLRVVAGAGSSPVELDRRIVDVGTTTTEVWFKTQASINGSDGDYYLYYGNPAAGAAPSHWADSMGADPTPSRVYLAADDFEDESVGNTPNGWEGSSNYTVQAIGGNKVLQVSGGSPTADYLFAGSYAWTDVVVDARLSVQQTSGSHYGLYARVESASKFDTLWFGLETNSTLALYRCTIASPSATALTSATSRGSWNINPAAGTSWHPLRVELEGQQARFYYDGVERTTYNIPGGGMTQGRVGLCAGYPASKAYWDDVVVRMHVSPEPTVSAAAEQTRCP